MRNQTGTGPSPDPVGSHPETVGDLFSGQPPVHRFEASETARFERDRSRYAGGNAARAENTSVVRFP
jgi:hypothetical protein